MTAYKQHPCIQFVGHASNGGRADSYDDAGNYIFPEGFDAETNEWLEGFDKQRTEWEAR